MDIEMQPLRGLSAREFLSVVLAFLCGAIGAFLLIISIWAQAHGVAAPLGWPESGYLEVGAIFSLALSFALNKGKPPLGLILKRKQAVH